MGKAIRIPVRVVKSGKELGEPDAKKVRSLPERPLAANESAAIGTREDENDLVSVDIEGLEEHRPPTISMRDGETDWCDHALRLQAEMENFRKRQRKLAQDQIESERQRLMFAFLRVVDNLERALGSPSAAADDAGLRQGVQLTLRAALQFLEQEGVEQVEAENHPFDPTWQEAISTIAHERAGTSPETVVRVLEPGYRLGNQLLRPAKVIVAM
jgi:molecular chaperone GrpE